MRPSSRHSVKSKPLPEWDEGTALQKPLCMYNSLKDQSLASYFGKGNQRSHLVSSGIITNDGRIVHMNRGFGRVVVAEQQFGNAERDEEQRGIQEFHLRKQLLARTSGSKEKMEKDNRVNKLRLAEHKALAKRKEERLQLNSKCKAGEEYAEERKQSMFSGKVNEEKRLYRMDWKRLTRVEPDKVVVTTTVRPATSGEQLEDSSSDESDRSSRSRSRSRSASPDSREGSPDTTPARGGEADEY
jgi:hypothetical protein